MMYWVFLGTVFTYAVILIFCVKTVLTSTENTQDVDVWFSAFVDAVCISTFTYVFIQIINNIVSAGRNRTVLKFCMLAICLCVPYILLYGLFEPRPIGLDYALSAYTMILIILTFISVHLTAKAMQDEEYNMEPGEFDPSQPVPLESRLPE